MRTLPLSMLVLATCAALAGACADGDSGATDVITVPSPTDPTQPVAATFGAVYAVLSARCLPCHSASGAGVTLGRLDMSTRAAAYASLVRVPPAGVACGRNGQGNRVLPGRPEESLLYLKVATDLPSPCGEKMPLDRPTLTRVELDLLRDWIANGANDD